MNRMLLFAAGLLWLATPLAGQTSSSRPPGDSLRNVSWSQVAVGAGLVLGVAAVDNRIAQAFHGQSSPGAVKTANLLDKFGEAPGMVAVIGGLAVTGLVTGNRATLRAAFRSAAGVALATVVTQVLKSAVGRQRPYLDPDLDGFDFHHPSSPAFPSGHATVAFALATSLGDAIGQDWARVGLYTLASGTAWARMVGEKHWFSDVLAGAGVGIVSAKFAAGHIRLFGIRAPRILLGSNGVGLGWTFATR